MAWIRDRSWAGVLTVGVVFALLAAGCGGDDGGLDLGSSDSGEQGDETDRDDNEGSEESPGEKLEVGTCYDRSNDDARDVVDDVEVPCDESHDAELIATLDPPTKTIPVDPDEINADLFPPCIDEAEAALGFPLTAARVNLAFTADGAPGGPYESEVRCFVTAPVKGGLLAPLDSGSIDEVTSDYVMLIDLSPGDCFLLSEDTAAGFPVDCTDPDALGFLGSFEAPDGPFPGNDALTALRDEECAVILDSFEDAPPPGLTVSGTPPSQIAWDFFDFRTVTCDVSAG